jgi:HPr Serine kinase C-terminal domain
MMRAHQATAVAIGGRALLIEGQPGSGKSSLALALIDRGAVLIGDDGVMLEAAGGRLLAHPHPETRGLLEVRGLGLLRFEVCEAVPVALALSLDREAPRFIEAAEIAERAGVSLPILRLWPDSPVLHVKAELALERFGLPSSPLAGEDSESLPL